MTKKIKILTISDHPIHALSGVGTQTRYIIEALFVYFIFFLIMLMGLNLGRKISSYIFDATSASVLPSENEEIGWAPTIINALAHISTFVVAI